MNPTQIEVGTKVREIRKKTGRSMKDLAGKVGVSVLTIQRIETGKVSPSIALLSEIAYHLNYPLASMVVEEERPVILIEGSKQPVIQSRNMKLKILAHRGVLDEDISVQAGKVEKGEFVSKHKNEGVELTYIIKGKHSFTYGGKRFEIKEGDLLCHSGKELHSVAALEAGEFLNILLLNR